VFLGLSGLLLVLWASSNASAQIAPEVSITCQPSIVELDVSPGQSGEGFSNCQVENKALYEVTVELSISDSSNNIDTILGKILLVIPGNGMEEVDVTFSADIRSPGETASFEINATVTKAGLIPLNENIQQSTNANVQVEIMDFIDFEYSSTGLTLNSAPGDSFNISAKVRNTGNVEIDVDFIVSNADELDLKGINCVPTLGLTLETSDYVDQNVMQCTVSDDFEESEELKIKVYAMATGQGLKKESGDTYVSVSISVPDEGGFGLGGLTDDISEENMKLIYAGGGLLALLVVLIILVKVLKRGGSSASAEWDDDDFDFDL
jgi:hypothetical protein